MISLTIELSVLFSAGAIGLLQLALKRASVVAMMIIDLMVDVVSLASPFHRASPDVSIYRPFRALIRNHKSEIRNQLKFRFHIKLFIDLIWPALWSA